MTAYHRLRIPASRGQGVTIHIWVHQILRKTSGKMKGSIQSLFFLSFCKIFYFLHFSRVVPLGARFQPWLLCTQKSLCTVFKSQYGINCFCLALASSPNSRVGEHTRPQMGTSRVSGKFLQWYKNGLSCKRCPYGKAKVINQGVRPRLGCQPRVL